MTRAIEYRRKEIKNICTLGNIYIMFVANDVLYFLFEFIDYVNTKQWIFNIFYSLELYFIIPFWKIIIWMQIFRELRGLRELTSKNTLLQKNTGSISKGAIAAIEIHLFFSRTIIFFVHLPKVIYQCSMSHIFSWNGARHTYLITRKHYT